MRFPTRDANKKIFGTKHGDPHKTNTTDGRQLWKLGYASLGVLYKKLSNRNKIDLQNSMS